MIENIGIYINRETKETYEVVKFKKKLSHRPFGGVQKSLQGNYEYLTSNGYHLQELDDNLSSFEIIEIDGVIHRIEGDEVNNE